MEEQTRISGKTDFRYKRKEQPLRLAKCMVAMSGRWRKTMVSPCGGTLLEPHIARLRLRVKGASRWVFVAMSGNVGFSRCRLW